MHVRSLAVLLAIALLLHVGCNRNTSNSQSTSSEATSRESTASEDSSRVGGFDYSAVNRKSSSLDARKECQKNIASGDKRFRGICGAASLYIPVLDAYETDDDPVIRGVIAKYGFVPMEGTSDCIVGTDNAAYADTAIAYAKANNESLIQLLGIDLKKRKR